MRGGEAIYFDGATSAKHAVSIELADELLRIRDTFGLVIDEWPFAELARIASPGHMLRLGLRGQPVPARLEIRDSALAATVAQEALSGERRGAIDVRARLRVVGWAVLATLSLVLVAVFVVPSLAARLTPFIPAGLEQRIGNSINAEVLAMLADGNSADQLTCGRQPGERQGRAALEVLVGKLSQAAALPMPIRVSVVRRSQANALAIPGGHIYLFQGLIDQTQSPDELAGVIGHEIGHVAHHDGTRAILQNAGLALMFGMALGDFAGGGAVVIAARTLVRSSYSRKAEAAADAYGVRLVDKAGGNGAALATILTRIEADKRPGMQIWLDHPKVQDRVRAIDAIAGGGKGAPLIDPDQWAALRHICASP